jgi:hypothetical protein
MCTIATSNSNNKREGRGGGREQQENNNNNNAAKQNYNQIRILIYFLGFWFGGWGFVVEPKLAIIHKKKI